MMLVAPLQPFANVLNRAKSSRSLAAFDSRDGRTIAGLPAVDEGIQ